jgi:general stress protein 26
MENNLNDKEALQKFRELAKEINICMFITNTANDQEHTRPMATIEVEEDGSLWFFTDARSTKVQEVNDEKIVHLVYAHPGKESYLDVWGNAQLVKDRQQIKDKWSTMVKAWFPEGVDDPNVALLKVKPTDAYYWEAKTGKMVKALKIAASVVTGTRLAEGAEGSLKL